jgi:metallo-beta-lactamase family protein
MRLTFLGATKTVTGSKFLISLGNKNILVDCGLFQGLKELREKNWAKFPIAPHLIDAVILTHAHIDHTGYLPVLIKNGFTGKVYCSQATKELCSVLLPDSGYLQEEEAKFANKHGYSKHKPALPLYTQAEAEHALKSFHPLEFRKVKKLSEETFVTLIPSGHILGASLVQFRHFDTTLLFTGDLGRLHDPIMRSPSIIQATDYLIIESTYGDRAHEKVDPIENLATVINQTIDRNGTVIIPAFAVGRAQHILYLIYQLKKSQRIPNNVPVYLDSPMAKHATEIFFKNSELHKLDAELTKQVCEVATYINSREESQALDLDARPKIIISASGMLEGGRVLHHFKSFCSDARNTILLTGYQAAGTRGAEIVKGKRELKMFGQTLTVNAEIKQLDNMSAHADSEEILEWLANFNHIPKKVFITHGELHAAESLKNKIEERFGWQCVVPDYNYSEIL